MRRLSACCCLSLLLFASAAAEQVHPVHGVVTAPLRDGLLTVAHREIPGYMPAMTMPFRVDPGAQAAAAALRRGDEIEFTFAVDGTSRAYDFRRVGHTTLAPGVAGAARVRLHAGDAVPAFALVDQDGHPFTADSLRGSRTVLTFIFTRCPVPEFCPRMSSQFAALQRRLHESPSAGAPVRLVSVSFDPEHDTPAVLQQYAARYDADPAIWRFCTGTPEQVRNFTQLFAVHVEANQGTIDHTLATALIGIDGRVQEIWRGNQWSVADVLRALAAPAGQGS